MAKVTQLKDLKITDVSSVDRGAGIGVRVMMMKRDDTKPELPPTLDSLVDAVMDIQKIDRPHAFVKVMGTLAGNEAYRRERDVRLWPEAVAKNSDEGGIGGQPPEKQRAYAAKKLKDIADSIKAQNPHMTSEQCFARAAGDHPDLRQAMDAPVSKAAPVAGRHGHGRVETSGNRFQTPGNTGDKTDREGIEPGEEGNGELQSTADAARALRQGIAEFARANGLGVAKATARFLATEKGRKLYAADRAARVGS